MQLCPCLVCLSNSHYFLPMSKQPSKDTGSPSLWLTGQVLSPEQEIWLHFCQSFFPLNCTLTSLSLALCHTYTDTQLFKNSGMKKRHFTKWLYIFRRRNREAVCKKTFLCSVVVGSVWAPAGQLAVCCTRTVAVRQQLGSVSEMEDWGVSQRWVSD